jgi:hypothetical protein
LFTFGGERPREQDAVGGARLTIEIGADFAIGPIFRLPPVPSRNRRISRRSLLLRVLLDVRLAGSEDGTRNGQHVRVRQLAVCANISKIKFW